MNLVRTMFRRVVVVLVKPTHYDNDGFPYRYWRGVLPSNSLAVMNSLTKQALHQIVPPEIPVEIHILEDGVKRHARKLQRLYRRFSGEGFVAMARRWMRRFLGQSDPANDTKLIVGLVAVQTAQFPRACDLIDRWRKTGATCVIGGFHVSGLISTMLDGIKDSKRPDVPCPQVMHPEIQALMDKDVIVFHGEAEGTWDKVLADILAGHPHALYRGGQPVLTDAPLPEYPDDYFKRSFATVVKTIDAGRGCPFTCKFCSVINVQGRTMRSRSTRAIVQSVEEDCKRHGGASFFFTDDNFARNPEREKLLDGLIELRLQGNRISFMQESDLASAKLPRYIEKLAQAGCSQEFQGVESMNPQNLAEASKKQNKVHEYEEHWRLCHKHDIAVHAGYIVGFPHDTPESVTRDVEELFRLGVDQVSFFMLTPIPGSEDHVRADAQEIPMDPDWNKYDSFHAVVDHPSMSHDEWTATYERAWRQFYRVENMVTALKRFRSRQARLNLLRNYVWYRWSFATEGTHPMIAGFYQCRDYDDRRPSAPPLTFERHLIRELSRHLRYFGRFVSEFYRFQHVVFETEFAPILARQGREWSGRVRGVNDWFRLTFGKWMSRQWLNAFWREYAGHRWRLLFDPRTYPWHLLTLPFGVSETVYTVRFASMLPRLVRSTTRL